MLVLAIGNICFAMLIAGYSRSGSANPALQIWQWAKLVQGAGHLLAWLRPDWPLVWLVVAANSALIVGVVLETAAFCTFFGPRRWKWLLYPALALALLVYNAVRLGGIPAPLPAFVFTTIMALFSGAIALTLLWPRQDGSFLLKIIGASNAVFFVCMCMRAWVGLAGDQAALLTGAVQTFTYLAGYMILIVNGFGFVLLCKEKDDAEMTRLATIDSLTGMANRRAFFERTDSARMLAARQGHPISLMMLDLDHFKRINDHYGHAAGDAALRVFADAAQQALREPDIMGRLGGEEFAIALPGTDLAGAVQAGERLRMAVRAAELPLCGPDYMITVSIGVVAIDPEEHINAALARADHALYVAKSAGRDRIEVGQPLRQPEPARA